MTTYERIYKHQNKRCFYCGEKTKFHSMEKDHVFPKSKGGRGIKNKVLSCHFCNHIKSNLIIDEFKVKVQEMLTSNIENKNKLEQILIRLQKLEHGEEIRKNMHKKASYKSANINLKPMKYNHGKI